MPQVRQRTLDATVTPRRVLLRHAYNQLLDLLSDTRTAQRAALRAPVKLLGDQAFVPAQEGVWRREGRQLFEAFAPQRVGERCEALTFGVSEPQPSAAELRFEDAVFREEIRDDLLLVTLQPASDHRDQDMQDHERSSGWRR